MYRVFRMSPFAPFFHTRVVSIHQAFSRDTFSGASGLLVEWDAPVFLLEQDSPNFKFWFSPLSGMPRLRQLLQVCGVVDAPTSRKGIDIIIDSSFPSWSIIKLISSFLEVEPYLAYLSQCLRRIL